ncbi:MAG: hypothetical protein KDJ29_20930 [Hyphomicrobiales bacterium]|nr:hypothetical protein [Hyphomicrobiales bacterium]
MATIANLALRHAKIAEKINAGVPDDKATDLWIEATEIERTLARTMPQTADERTHLLAVVANALQVSGETFLARIVRAAAL